MTYSTFNVIMEFLLYSFNCVNFDCDKRNGGSRENIAGLIFTCIFLKIQTTNLLDFCAFTRKSRGAMRKKLQYTSHLRKHKWQTISQGGSLLRTRQRAPSDSLKLQKCEREVAARLVYSRTSRSSSNNHADYSRHHLLTLSPQVTTIVGIHQVFGRL